MKYDERLKGMEVSVLLNTQAVFTIVSTIVFGALMVLMFMNRADVADKNQKQETMDQENLVHIDR